MSTKTNKIKKMKRSLYQDLGAIHPAKSQPRSRKLGRTIFGQFPLTVIKLSEEDTKRIGGIA